MLWKEAGEHGGSTQGVFMHLIRTNNLAGLEFFLELGADIEFRLNAKVGLKCQPTALLIAAHLDKVPLARSLLEKGAKVQYFGKISPLHVARSAEMVQLLLDHNADPELLDNMRYRPLCYYVSRKDSYVSPEDIGAMRAILQHGVEVDPIGVSVEPLHAAAQRSLAAVELLVEYGADVEKKGFMGKTPLHVAANAGKTDVAKFLVERWPEGMRERENRSGDTPLHLAARRARTEVVRLLVERWPEGKEVLNYDGKTPFSVFEEDTWRKFGFSDEDTEIVALLSSPYSKINNE
jgi:ankyrin repeat protein